ncbi:MAG: glycosyltransferase [Verrucomicrobiota bacterium]
MPDPTPPPGINLVGYLAGGFGLGETARLVSQALKLTSIPVHEFATRDFGETDILDTTAKEPAGSPPHDTNLFCFNGDTLPNFAKQVGRQFFDDRRNIGLWFWETEDLPPDHQAGFAYLDEVWTTSTFVQNAVEKNAPIPVRRFPHPVVMQELGDPTLLDKYHLGNRFVFLFIFDLRSTLQRKNPEGLIDSFIRAFPEQQPDGPLLVIKTNCGDFFGVDLAILKTLAQGRTDIIFIDGFIPLAEKNALIQRCDCYTSLHRAEGFGQTLIEAMALGKPCLGTAYSGNLEFMTDDNSYLCPARRVSVGTGSRLFPPDSTWAEPDVDAAATLLRHIFANPEESRKKGERARRDIVENHSLDITAQALTRLFENRPPLAKDRRPDSLFRQFHNKRGHSLIRRPITEKIKKFKPKNWLSKKLYPDLEQLLATYDKENSKAISAALSSIKETEHKLEFRLQVLEDQHHQANRLAEIVARTHPPSGPAGKTTTSYKPSSADDLATLKKKISRLGANDPISPDRSIPHLSRGMPKPYLDAARLLLRSIGGRSIVEIGSMRKPFSHHPDFLDPECCNDGHSTWFWARDGFQVTSVDISTEASEAARAACAGFPNCTIVNADGLEFLKSHDQTIDLLYLDGWDVDPDTPYAENHLLAYQHARPKLSPDHIITIDDTDVDNGGKGRQLVPALLDDGYEILVQGRQTIAIKLTLKD